MDTEFNSTKEPQVNPVCAVIIDTQEKKIFKYWTYNNPKGKEEFKKKSESLKDRVWGSFNVVAEGSFFLSCGLNPVEFKWEDYFIEYRQLTNSNDELGYGNQLVDGKVKFTKRPPSKFQRTEEDIAQGFKPTHSLAEATYKLTGQIRDTEHKNLMRDIIISNDAELIEANRDAILEYCKEDTIFLPVIRDKIYFYYKKLLTQNEMQRLPKEVLLRGKYMALTANMERRGYPVNVEQARNFTNSINAVINNCCKEINQLFPEIRPFRWNRKEFRYSWNQNVTKDWIKANIPDWEKSWLKTDTKDISLSLDAWDRFFPFRHSYPKDNFGAQIVRYLKIKQNLYGFAEKKGKKSFWDYVGSDGRVRPYTNPYGAQSSRSQPAANGFLFLKPAWVRSLCQPKKGRAVGSFDYGSQEFLVSALLSGDKKMIEAYASGDVYLAFAKQAGAVPKHGTKQEYKAERDLFKATVLAVSYLMTAKGLAAKITQDTGRECTEAQAQELIDMFYDTYSDFAYWQNTIVENYYELRQYIELPCGWRMFADNDNFRSVANCGVQGTAASIMRKAVEFCEEAGLEVIFTLHDALYIEFDSDDMTAMDKLRDCMLRGFQYYFKDKKSAALIRQDGKVWSPDYTEDNPLIKNGNIITAKGQEISASEIFIDERSYKEYEQFSPYFNDTGLDLL